MLKKSINRILTITCAAMMTAAVTMNVMAEPDNHDIVTDSTEYVVTVDAESVNINKNEDTEEVLTSAEKGSSFEVLEDMGDGWVKVSVGSEEGYLPASGNATIRKMSEEEKQEKQKEASSANRRANLVNYALQFVGGRYVSGGNDPHTGVDCSGFTKYVLGNGAGVSLNRSSRAQATQGKDVSADQMRPGDLLFYANGSTINHVAMYIGNGQVVHASTYKTGITVSNWNYRTPVKIKNVIGD